LAHRRLKAQNAGILERIFGIELRSIYEEEDSCWSRDCGISGTFGCGCGRSLRQAGKPDRGCGSNGGHRRDTERN